MQEEFAAVKPTPAVSRSLLDRWLPRHEERIVKKLVRSWLVEGIGWYAVTEIAARALIEGGVVLALASLGWNLLGIALGWLLVHTLAWFILYDGFMRVWVVLGFTKRLVDLEAHLERLASRARRQSVFQLVFAGGSAARGAMSVTSDIDIFMAPRPGIRDHVLGIGFLWGLRVESLVRLIPVEARWMDAERYAPYLYGGVTPRILFRDERMRGSVAERLASRGLLITISGLDGSGKTSVARRIVQRLQAAGSSAVYLWCHRQPWFVSDHGPDISFAILYESLWKRIGRDLTDFGNHPFANFFYDLFTAVDYLYVRWKLSRLRCPNTIIVADRYVADVLAYLRTVGALEKAIEGFLVGASYEPDLAILFELDAETARARKQENPLDQLRLFSEEYANLTPLLRLEPVDARVPLETLTGRVEALLRTRLGISVSID